MATLENMVVGGLTFEQGESWHRQGIISDRVWRHYVTLWIWSAPRFGGSAARAQDRLYDRLGRDAFYRRIDRVKAIIERIKARASSWGSDPARGAALGRANTTPAATDARHGRKFALSRVRINRGGYDDAGAYWGVGAPLWWATADDAGEFISEYFRASDRSAARAKISADYPGARFYR